jgi:DeoR/GlpR family transcriptional regulator of sugar metabolism
MTDSLETVAPTPELPENRRRKIAQRLQAIGSVSIAEIEREFGISAMTARRDLRTLEQEGIALRTYGGAMIPAAAATLGSFEERMHEDVAGKERLAKGVLDLVADGDRVFVDSSTASYFAVRELVATGCKLTVITNSLPVMDLVGDARRCELVALGGSFDATNRAFDGPDTIRTAQNLLADKALITFKGLTNDGGLSDTYALEAEVKRAMIEQATTSILLVTAKTLAHRGNLVAGSVRDLSIVLAAEISDDDEHRLRRMRANLVRL